MLRAALVLLAASAALYVRYYALPPILAQFPLAPELAFLLALPLLLLPLLGIRPRDAGITVGKTGQCLKFVTLALFVSLPFLFFAAQLPAFNSYYPLFGWARDSPLNLAAYEVLILSLMLTTEFFFRGFLMMGMRGIGQPGALLVQNIPYTLVHLGKPMLELPASFFAGLAFGWIDFKAGSVLPSTILHWSINVAFDAFCIYFYFSR